MREGEKNTYNTYACMNKSLKKSLFFFLPKIAAFMKESMLVCVKVGDI